MSSRSGTKASQRVRRCSASALAGCSDIYYDRRETVSLRRRRRDGGQPGHADDRSVAAPQRQQQHRLQRRADAGRGGALQPRQGHPAGACRRPASTAYQAVQQQAASRSRRPGVDVGDTGGGGQAPGSRDGSRAASVERVSMRMSRVQRARRTRPGGRADRRCRLRGAVRATFGASAQIELRVVSGTIDSVGDSFDVEGATVVVIDLDAASAERDGGAGAADGARSAPGRRWSWSRRASTPRSRARCCRCGSPTSW